MNILFLGHIRTDDDANMLNTILGVLARSGSEPTLALRKNRRINLTDNSLSAIKQLTFSEPNKLKLAHYDLMLTYNTTGSGQLKALAKRNDIPTVCMMDAQTFAKEYPMNQRHVNKLVLITPPRNFPAMLLQQDIVFPWRIAVTIPAFKKYRLNNSNKPRVLVIIHHQNLFFSPFYQIAPWLNKLLNFDIKVVSDNMALRKMLNPNIKVIAQKGIDIDHLIAETDIVVGSSNAALKAIALGKPVIVAGERGYGGLLNRENFLVQYHNHFQGRIGGELGEHIPEKLLMDNVLDLLEWGSERVNKMVKENHQLLKKESAKQEKALLDFLQRTVNTHEQLKNDFWTMKLKLSGAWQLLLLTQDKYVLNNIQTGYVHSHFEKEEAEIIHLFGKGIEMKKALTASGYEEEPEMFAEFVQDLVHEKILVAT
ncbi:hypothetical protein SAMN06265379_105178 [Saccharicrinis carchari]|uniref:Uncharacterized protein n=1 Tax=Saccharicrinis carchari TaxID=1168039 RepID=A0A521DGZ2_SACCC|nr:hypothetical protein [Saccharicrinis carchari]SMO70983.1 hypothetical protein SAMN06265379_105178 [Saccharicrinis carchari]